MKFTSICWGLLFQHVPDGSIFVEGVTWMISYQEAPLLGVRWLVRVKTHQGRPQLTSISRSLVDQATTPVSVPIMYHFRTSPILLGKLSTLPSGFWHCFVVPQSYSFHRPFFWSKETSTAAVLHSWDVDTFIDILDDDTTTFSVEGSKVMLAVLTLKPMTFHKVKQWTSLFLKLMKWLCV